MIEKDDWRLLNDFEFLKGQCLDAVCSDEIIEHLPELNHCLFCWDSLTDNLKYYETWYITKDRKDCICGSCCNDFKELLNLELTDGGDVEWD